MPLRILDADAVRRLLPMAHCIPLMRQAFKLVAEGRAEQPIRQALHAPSGKGLLSMMPGYIADPAWLGIKVVSVFPGNFGGDLGSHQGLVLLFDPQSGSPVAILDGREITAIRTAAATAAATDVLARPDAATLAIFGYGEQARTHLEAMPLVRAFREVIVWGRDPEKARAFCAEHAESAACPLRQAVDAQDAASADVLCLTTAAAEPYFLGTWLRPGQHVNVVGSSIPTTSEIDVETVVRARVFVDFADSALALGGDLRRAIGEGAVEVSHIVGGVGDVIIGRTPGRCSPQEITLFKSLGMISEDLVSADHILRGALATGVGTEVVW